MDRKDTLRRYGLFDAKVPRYTSYPPANRFETGIGARHQEDWLNTLPPDEAVSVYAHIPFCRRLCWFCACRTQGTKTMAPVEAYVDVLRHEIQTVTDRLGPTASMRRLHLGGGTPTLLTPEQMTGLLDTLEGGFSRSDDYEFSVEIDPTEAAPGIIDCLARRQMARASIGVQDFDPKVQKAIGRIQGFDLTQDVIDALRAGGVRSLNIDFLYGLPFQTVDSLLKTLDQVVSLRPDRLALYGYAHVPHVSKRQVMIPDAALPGPEARYDMAQSAKERLVAAGYVALGIDHFALPHDSLTHAAHKGTMSRNFQGYTDDPCRTLIGFGASAISRYPQGYLQNAVATAAYTGRVQTSGLAAHKGFVMTPEDDFVAALINGIMCDGKIVFAPVLEAFPDRSAELAAVVDDLMLTFPDLICCTATEAAIPTSLNVAARLVASHLDRMRQAEYVHSLAV